MKSLTSILLALLFASAMPLTLLADYTRLQALDVVMTNIVQGDSDDVDVWSDTLLIPPELIKHKTIISF